MLGRIDVAVPAGQIAGGEDMEKDIAFARLEADSPGNGGHGFSLGD
jgi:hypothetical protein